MPYKFEARGQASDWLSPLLSKKAMGKIDGVFNSGFNLKVADQLIYVSNYYPGYLSAIGFQWLDLDMDQAFLNDLKVGQIVRLTPESWTFFTRPQAITVIIKDLDYKSFKLKRLDPELTQVQALKEAFMAHFRFENTGFAQASSLKVLWHDFQEASTIEDYRPLVRSLVGHGPGLTPSGDDFLQGLLLMEASLTDARDFYDLINQAIKDRSTSRVSLAYYQALMAGYLNEPWHRLFSQWQEADRQGMAKTIEDLLRYGHTSGSDMVLGSLAYLEKYEKNLEEKYD